MDLAPGASASPQLARDDGRRSDPLGVGFPLASSFGAVPDELLHDLLDQIDLSVVVVDPAEQKVVYANRHAGVTLSPTPGEAAPDGFAALLAACSLGLEDSWGRARTARIGERTVG
ncbi:MAG: hypothetical protein K8H90_08605, partial [Thermoanaerobaculia bacterium]|nr:hypothetical protein [Thermoanaerobaculia bacterium]